MLGLFDARPKILAWVLFLMSAALVTWNQFDPPTQLERTFSMIKPDSFDQRREILAILEDNGFDIITTSERQLTSEVVDDFYVEHRERTFYKALAHSLMTGPVLCMVLEKDGAIPHLRELIGPTQPASAQLHAPNSIRAKFGKDKTRNAIHASDSFENANREIVLMFGPSYLLPEDQVKYYAETDEL